MKEPTEQYGIPQEEYNDVIGTIIERRSMGRNLAFVEMQPCLSSSQQSRLSIVFRRAGWSDKHDNWDAFPVKSAALPHGARIQCWLRPTSRGGNRRGSSAPLYEVMAWKILEHPKEVALERATVEGAEIRGGISNTEYFRARASNCQRHQEQRVKGSTESQRKPRPRSSSNHEASGSKASASRSRIFANFVMNNILDTDNSTDRVLDIAGGKGHLAIEIAIQSKLQCFVVDPVVRKQWPKKHSKRLTKASAPIPQFLSQPFNKEAARDILQQADVVSAQHSCCFVGLHPDEPTEDIVDTALALDCSFAVVPCCVFPSFFPTRTLRATGRTVHTYDDFLKYLLEKDPRIQQASLGFEGKNQVVFYKRLSTTRPEEERSTQS